MIPEDRITKLEEQLRRMDSGFRNASQIDPQYAKVIRLIAEEIVEGLKLTDLSDVNTGAANGQVIKWNSGTEEWEPANDLDT